MDTTAAAPDAGDAAGLWTDTSAAANEEDLDAVATASADPAGGSTADLIGPEGSSEGDAIDSSASWADASEVSDDDGTHRERADASGAWAEPEEASEDRAAASMEPVAGDEGAWADPTAPDEAGDDELLAADESTGTPPDAIADGSVDGPLADATEGAWTDESAGEPADQQALAEPGPSAQLSEAEAFAPDDGEVTEAWTNKPSGEEPDAPDEVPPAAVSPAPAESAAHATAEIGDAIADALADEAPSEDWAVGEVGRTEPGATQQQEPQAWVVHQAAEVFQHAGEGSSTEPSAIEASDAEAPDEAQPESEGELARAELELREAHDRSRAAQAAASRALAMARAAQRASEEEAVQRAEHARLAAELEAREREALEREAREKDEREQLEAHARREREEQERVERALAEQARKAEEAAQRAAAERLENERQAAAELARLEQAQLTQQAEEERQRLTAQLEAERRARELNEAEAAELQAAIERERLERERVAKELEARTRAEREERERLARELEERSQREREERERLAQELELRTQREREERERLARELAENTAREQAERERLAQELEALRREARAAHERAEAEKAQREELERAAEIARAEARELAARAEAALVTIPKGDGVMERLPRTGIAATERLAEIVRQLVTARVDVRLELKADDALRILWLRNGGIAGAISTAPGESVLDRARQDGLIDPTQLRALAPWRERPASDQLAVLRERGLLRDSEQIPLVQRHTEAIALAAFSESGSIYRLSTEALPAEVPLAAATRSVIHLLAEGLRRAADPDSALEPAGGLRAVPILRRGDLDASRLELSERERRFLATIDGEATVESLVLSSGLRQDAALRLIVVARALGLLDLMPAADPAPGDPPPELEVHRLHAKLEEIRDADYFAVLGVTRSAGRDEILRAYSLLSTEFHPLRFSAHPDPAITRRAEEIQSVLEEAVAALGDDRLRGQYARNLTD